jgi:muramoyltetrapeptide carboxypeptidase
MKAPKPVASGTCGVFAPSSPFPPDRYEQGRAKLERLGLAIHEPHHLRDVHGYLAGTDEARLRDFHALLDDPSVDVLWAARGGYGLHRIADRIDPDRIRRANKPIVGFSDVCVIHAIAQAEAELITIHGPVITQLADLGDRELDSLRLALSGDLSALAYEATGPIIRGGRAEGRILGGCLSVIAPMIGTDLLPSFEGAILLLEDVGEATYRIDRLLSHLRLAGVLSVVAGVALGDFEGCNPRKPGEQTIEEVLADRLGDLGVPVVAGLPFGHGRRNLALPLGARVVLDASARRLSVIGP